MKYSKCFIFLWYNTNPINHNPLHHQQQSQINMKLIQLSLFLLGITLHSLPLCAQENFTVQEGQLVDRKKNIIYELIGEDSGDIYYVNYKGRDRYIEKSDVNQNVLASVPVPKNELYNDKKLIFVNAIIMRDFIGFLYSCVDKTNNEYTVYIRKHDKENLKATDELKELLRAPMPATKAVMMTPFSDPNYVQDVISSIYRKISYVSDDKTKFMIYRNNNDYDKNAHEKIHISVFDQNLDRLLEKDYEMKYNSKDFTVSSILLNNQGEVYITGVHFLTGRNAAEKRQKKEQDYIYHLISIKASDLAVSDMPIKLKSNFISELKIALNNQGKPFAVGFYSEKDENSIKGVFFLTFDPETGNVSTEVETVFDKDFIQDGMDKQELRQSNRSATKGSLEMAYHDLNALIVHANNEVTLLAEKVYTSSVTFTDASGKTSTSIVYHYDEIILINLSPTGEVRWKTKIPKSQTGKDNSSFAVLSLSDKIVVLFNDNQKNVDMSPESQPEPLTTKNYGVMVVEVNTGTGKFEKNLILPRSTNDIMLKPREALVSNSGFVILNGNKDGRKYQFVEVRFSKN